MNLYLLFKSLHLVAVISWMAGLLYLPRIFVYHSEAEHESQKSVFKIMERKLYNYIMMPTGISQEIQQLMIYQLKLLLKIKTYLKYLMQVEIN